VTARDDDWLVTELCAGFLDKGADFSGDVTLTLVDEPAPFLLEAQLAVGDVRRDSRRKRRRRRKA
jgi:hypothetical protein